LPARDAGPRLAARAGKSTDGKIEEEYRARFALA
jgi:hypothetical protein